MRLSLTYCALMAMILLMSCGKDVREPENTGDYIAFYIKSETAGSKAAIENTDTLLSLKPAIVVKDWTEGSTIFQNESVNYTDNGVWVSGTDWTSGRNYLFSAYVASAGSGSVSVSSSGLYTVNITEPTSYSDSDNAWADFLLSYKVSANGTQKPLVQLNLERITAAVELYMTMGTKMKQVIVNEIQFRNVATAAKYENTYHATPTDTDELYGMRNIWRCELDESSRTTYSYAPAGGISLNVYDADAGRFDINNRVMRFLTVHQDTELDAGYVELYVKYTVLEDDHQMTYEADFPLSTFTPKVWVRGHKVRYYISIDSSIELSGIVAEWQSVDFIESTLLPSGSN